MPRLLFHPVMAMRLHSRLKDYLTTRRLEMSMPLGGFSGLNSIFVGSVALSAWKRIIESAFANADR